MSSKVHGVKAKDIAGYMIMPRIVPRARKLFTSGFGYLAFLMANVYAMVRLLPPAHPYLNPANIGKFGLRHVIAEAANHLVVKKENIDQLVIFAALLAGTVLLALQFVLLLWSLFIQQAEAAGLFGTLAPADDIAFMLLDHVFGVPGVFNSCVTTAVACIGDTPPIVPPAPFPFHTALHSLFAFYSMGLLLIAVLIFLYFIIVVIVETASTGTPFGKRFQHIWVPIRLVVALALLIPAANGLNSGQYIALYAAKFGSGFATNAWLEFNDTAADHDMFNNFAGGPAFPNPLGERAGLIALPKQQDASILTGMMALVHSCAYAYWKYANRPGDGILDAAAPVKPYLVKSNPGWLIGPPSERMQVDPGTSYAEALQFYDDGDILIRFGQHVPGSNEKGEVEPLCGDIRIRVGDIGIAGGGGAIGAILANIGVMGGPEYIIRSYFDLIRDMWYLDIRFQEFALRIVEINTQNQFAHETPVRYPQCGDVQPPSAGCGAGSNLPACAGGPPPPCQEGKPGIEWKQDIADFYQGIMNANLLEAWTLYTLFGAQTEIDASILNRGWAGAGIWYNKIAQYNGTFISSVMDVPALEQYPQVMEEVRAIKRREDSNFDASKMFEPNLSSGEPVPLEGGNSSDLEIAGALYSTYDYLTESGLNQISQEKDPSSNPIIDTIHAIFGTSGLFDMRRENAHTHPLASLVAVGKSLVESTIRNIGYASAFSFGGGLMGVFENTKAYGDALNAFSGLLMGISFLGLTAGLVLFYVLPFLPFLYFYFAVASWVKGVFEAMVGVPLWALAHLRLDGNGLPGDSAQHGYFLIFEIFVRPILTVFALIAAIAIFGAQVRVLNIIWDMVLENLSGFNTDPTWLLPIAGLPLKRGIIDQFFFTIIYTIIVYMLATASFKLIDRIPDDILRWMGAGVSSFSDINQENVEAISRQVGTGGMVFSRQITQGISGFSSGAGQAVGSAMKTRGVAPSNPGRTPRGLDDMIDLMKK